MRKTAWVLLLLLAFAIPWEYSLDLGPSLGNIARLIGVLLLLAAIPAVLRTGAFRRPDVLLGLVLALYLWFCLTYFWTIDPEATLEKLRGYFQEMMIVWLVWEFAEEADDLRALLRAWLAGSWVLAALTASSFVVAAAGGGAQIRFVAVGQDPNDAARLLAMGFPLAAVLVDWENRRLGKLLALGYLPFGLGAVLLTGSRGGLVAAAVALAGCGAVLMQKHARAVLGALAALPAVAAALWYALPQKTLERLGSIAEQAQGGDLNQRVNIWEAGIRAFARQPFQGYGAGAFADAAGLSPIDTAHNTALSILVEGGIFGLALAAALWILGVRCVLRTRGQLRIALMTLLAVWSIGSLVGTTTESRTTWLMFGMLALAARVTAEEPGLAATSLALDVARSASIAMSLAGSQGETG